MMFLGTSRKADEIKPEQKWDAISLRDFKARSCFAYLAYGYLYFSILLSLAVYGVDIFTAINLLAFNQWSSTIEPTQLLPFDVTKWIFAGTIIASFVNLAFEHLRAWRVMRRESVAECYLDNLAVRLESVRVGKGQGWRRFLVFAELTKSKKGAEYVALFSYFSLQSWIRVLVCSGPRQVVNALTLYGLFTSDLTPKDASSFNSTVQGFFANFKALAAENSKQAVIFSGMLFTLIIWIFSFLFLLIGVLFFVFFLWHYIPRQDGGLHGYCERKVNKRLKSIVTKTINKAIAKEDLKFVRAEDKLPGGQPRLERQATLPPIMDLDLENGDKLPEMPMLQRNDTVSTLPAYTSRPGTPGSIELASLEQKRPMPTRQGTNLTSVSTSSYSSRASLVNSAAEMGSDRFPSPEPTLPHIDMTGYEPPRHGTPMSNRSFDQQLPMYAQRSADSLAGMPDRVLSPVSAPNGFSGPSGYPMNRPYPPPMPNDGGRSSQASSSSSAYPRRGGPGYHHHPPPRSASKQPPLAQRQRFMPQRNVTAPQGGFDRGYGGNSGYRGYNDGTNSYDSARY
ncbi:hypothetical protein F5Y17DRAFT_269338 [Xylariaceae sp. FL0594]|nr:hypothetical protein F5Y17DRAFT_269338 [Xylariaceae sp. FL0594]